MLDFNIRNSQIKYYTKILKEGEYLLLKSKDEFFKNHYISSPLNVLTGFSGTEGEAVIDKNGKITIFVDTRYHLLVEKQVYSNVSIYKMKLGETFFDAFKNKFKKDTVFYVPETILMNDYLKYGSYFDLRKYELKNAFNKNFDFRKNQKIFLVDKNIEKQDFNYKLEKLKSNFSKDRVLILNLDIISYLTNLRSYQTNYSSNFRSILYLDFKNNKNVLFLDKTFFNNANKIKINNLIIKDLKEFYTFIKTVNDSIAIDFKDITFKDYLAIKNPVEFTKKEELFLPMLASIKPKSAIEHLINASKKLDSAIYSFRKKLKTGLSEYDLVKIFEAELVKKGAFCPSFKTILALDDNTASIHYSSYDKNKILKNESILLLDCGGYYEAGYATDITRTFYFGNNPNPYYKKIYTNVLKAFLMCYVSKETSAKQLDLLARGFLEPFQNEGFFFNHGLGHGIGTSCHQNPPRISFTSNDIIKPYQTHSIEPGLYGKNIETGLKFGVRIENCVYSDIDYNKISLSRFPFEEKLIDYNILTKQEKAIIEYWNYNE